MFDLMPAASVVMAAADSGSGNTATTLLIAALGAGGLGAIIAAAITGLFSKRKLGAEATKIIADAAASVVSDLREEIVRQQGIVVTNNAEHAALVVKLTAEHAAAIMAAEAKMVAMSKSHAEEIEEYRRVLQLHVAWDTIAIAEVSKLGVDLPPAPPLIPARRFEHPAV
jgi:hypothetical protein